MRLTSLAACCWPLVLAACGDDGGENQNANQNQGHAICGNGVVEAAEECDDGAANSDTLPDACRTACRTARCGDGTVDASEACDDGPGNSDTLPDACRTICLAPTCGDGVLDPGMGEACDRGEYNDDAPNAACRTDCQVGRCGDGIVDDQRFEVCDEGAANSDTAADACRTSCQPPRCGDGVTDPLHGEDCDDGGTEPGDGCGPTCRLEVCGNGVHDALAGEACDDGNSASHDGCSSSCAAEAVGWRPGLTAPGQLCHARMLGFDEARAQVVALGRWCRGEAISEDTVTWEFDGTAWGRTAAGAALPPTLGGFLAHDPDAGVTYLAMVEGFFDPESTSWWRYDGVVHTEVQAGDGPGGIGPMIFDSVRGRLVMIVGPDEIWELVANVWTRVTPSSPLPPYQAVFGYDRARGVTVALVPGEGTFEYDGDGWTEIATARRLTGAPVLVFSVPDGHLVARDPGTGVSRRYDGSDWTLLGTGAAAPEPVGPCTGDPARGHVLCLNEANELLRFDGASWSRPATAPARRERAVLVGDPRRARLVLAGGVDAAGVILDDAWAFDGRIWQALPPAAAPPPRLDAAATHEALSDRVIIHGGEDEAGFRSDTWVIDASGGSALAAAVTPPARARHALAHDPARGRTVVFGGEGGSGVLGDTWELDGDTWTLIDVPEPPPARAEARLAYVPFAGGVVLMGGRGADGLPLGDLWRFDGTDWTPLDEPLSPPPRSAPGVAWDDDRQRLVLFGGEGETGALDDTWEYGAFGWRPVVSTLAPLAARCPALAHLGAIRAMVLSVGFTSDPEAFWWLRPTSNDPDEVCGNRVDDDGDGLVDCTDDDCAGLPCGPGTCQQGVCQ
jgi:cysteine-rich repeat protein